MLETRLSLTWKAKKPREVACTLIAYALEPILPAFDAMPALLVATAEELVEALPVLAAMFEVLAAIWLDRAGT